VAALAIGMTMSFSIAVASAYRLVSISTLVTIAGTGTPVHRLRLAAIARKYEPRDQPIML
jgi:hypothetical protein